MNLVDAPIIEIRKLYCGDGFVILERVPVDPQMLPEGMERFAFDVTVVKRHGKRELRASTIVQIPGAATPRQALEQVPPLYEKAKREAERRLAHKLLEMK